MLGPGVPAGIRKVRKCVPSGTAIKTWVDAYNLRLISRRCEDLRHYGAMVRSDF